MDTDYREGLAWVSLSEGLLRTLLHYPDNARIVGVEMTAPASLGRDAVVRFLFASPDLPESYPAIPDVAPAITAVHQQRAFDAPERADEYVWDWGL